MPKLTLSALAVAVDGQLIGNDCELSGAVADHRQVKCGQVFFALAGARHDGHDYVVEAVNLGAAAAIVSRWGLYPCPVVMVPDTKLALGQMARMHLASSSAKVVAITGSVGKTSVKELTAAALAGTMTVYRSPGNYNTEIGLPLSILNHIDEDVLVLEMGMRGFGQIAALTEIAPPDVVIVTNVGEAHIELLGSRANIARAKGEILLGMKVGGTAILNRDDAYYDFHFALATGPVLSVGHHREADLRIAEVNLDEKGNCHYALHSGAEAWSVKTSWPGRHNAENSALAIAAAVVLGVDIAQAIAGIESGHIASQRLEILDVPGGYTLIDDTYNASPSSVAAALGTLDEYAGQRRKIGVLGSMFELGERSFSAHQEAGDLAKRVCDVVLTIGKEAQVLSKVTADGGVRTYHCDSVAQVLLVLRAELQQGDVVLVKGSRGMQMERITAVMRRGDV